MLGRRGGIIRPLVDAGNWFVVGCRIRDGGRFMRLFDLIAVLIVMASGFSYLNLRLL